MKDGAISNWLSTPPLLRRLRWFVLSTLLPTELLDHETSSLPHAPCVLENSELHLMLIQQTRQDLVVVPAISSGDVPN